MSYRDEETIERYAELLSLLYPATDDEIKLITDVASKLMGEGRREYAALDLDTEPRTAADFVREAYDEGIDSLLYLGMAKGKLERAESTAIAGPDDDPSPAAAKLTSLNDTRHLGTIFSCKITYKRDLVTVWLLLGFCMACVALGWCG